MQRQAGYLIWFSTVADEAGLIITVFASSIGWPLGVVNGKDNVGNIGVQWPCNMRL